MAKGIKKVLKIACQGAGALSIDLIQPLQGDLKSLSKENYERLRAEIERDGFSFPFAVWENPADGGLYILDGHQRRETLVRMRKDGWEIPEVPIVFVEADDIKQAKHKLLAAASQYGKVESDGLLEFIGNDFLADDLVSHFNFPEIDIKALSLEHLQSVMGSDTEVDETVKVEAYERAKSLPDEEQVRQVAVFFNGKTHPEFMTMIAKIQQVKGLKNLSDTLLEVTREAFAALGKK